MLTFGGTYTALITPFREQQIDTDGLRLLVRRQIEAGVEGLVPCGTTGEAPTLTLAEHTQVIHEVVQGAQGKAPVIAGAGSNNTAHAIELAQAAEAAGADAILSVAPYYNKPSADGLFAHFAAIAEATSLPIVLYNIPGRCGVEIEVSTICRLRKQYPNIAAVKHATGSVVGAADLLQTCDIPMLSGDDPLTLPLMSVGAVGVISVAANLAPRAVRRVTSAALAGDFVAAQVAARVVYPLARALLTLDSNPVPVKTALAMRGLTAEEFRLPLVPLSPTRREALAGLLAEQLPRLREPDL